ncbi:TPA: hypothetical protein VZJ74_002240 [Streptococcus pneumoniae]|nr:hypothetical protein [Streptococcus pneumoniae]HEV8874511.1 hypothetical protein [Streptococcus pneumoniae]
MNIMYLSLRVKLMARRKLFSVAWAEKWNETAKQLYNVIMWLIILWNAKPDTPLFNFKDEVIKYKTYEPFESSIKLVSINE